MTARETPRAQRLVIGERIRQSRFRAGFTSQAALGERLGTAAKQVSLWERGEAAPSLNMVIRICEVTGVSADYLLDLSDLGMAPRARGAK